MFYASLGLSSWPESLYHIMLVKSQDAASGFILIVGRMIVLIVIRSLGIDARGFFPTEMRCRLGLLLRQWRHSDLRQRKRWRKGRIRRWNDKQDFLDNPMTQWRSAKKPAQILSIKTTKQMLSILLSDQKHLLCTLTCLCLVGVYKIYIRCRLNIINYKKILEMKKICGEMQTTWSPPRCTPASKTPDR